MSLFLVVLLAGLFLRSCLFLWCTTLLFGCCILTNLQVAKTFDRWVDARNLEVRPKSRRADIRTRACPMYVCMYVRLFVFMYVPV